MIHANPTERGVMLDPDSAPTWFSAAETTKTPREGGEKQLLLIACGALAREVLDIIGHCGWTHITVTCLPAKLHNRPAEIPERVREKIHAARGRYDDIFVVYGDCGTGGKLDKVLAEEGVQRIAGPHCYAFFSGLDDFARHEEDDVTSFFVTDFLARHFHRLVWCGLGLDRYPELLPDYFGHYRKLVYLAQTDDRTLDGYAAQAAERLGLIYERRAVGYGDVVSTLRDFAAPTA